MSAPYPKSNKTRDEYMWARSLSFIFVTLYSIATNVVQGEEWGNLKGKFIYDGPVPPQKALQVVNPLRKSPVTDESLLVGPAGELQNVVVWVRTPNLAIHKEDLKTANDTVTITAANFEFKPHVLGMRFTQPLELKNNDPAGQSFVVDFSANKSINTLLPANAVVKQSLNTEEGWPVRFSSAMHPYMKGWLLVRPDPFFAVSNDKGKFEIRNLPADTELTFAVRHERPGYVQNAKINGQDAGWKIEPSHKKRYAFKYMIQPGDNDLGEIKLDPRQFN